MPIQETDAVDQALPTYATPISVSYFQVVRRLGSLYWKLQREERGFTQHLHKVLPGFLRGQLTTFSPEQIKRFVKYWQLAHHVICDNISQLSGHSMTADEKHRIILLSVFAPLFDDLLDDGILQQEEIMRLISTPDQHISKQATDQIVLDIYQELLKTVPNVSLFKQHLQTVASWQNASQQQLSPSIPEAVLYQITYNKSYYGIRLFCAVLDKYPTAAIVELLYPVAGLLQLTNDAFDVWKDIHKDVYTLPNLYRNFGQLQHQFMAEVTSINQQLDRLPYPAAAKTNFSITIHALNAMGWMSLQQLKAVTANVNSVESLKSLTRQQLVCDLDSIPQKFRWLKLVHYFANFSSVLSAKPYQGKPGTEIIDQDHMPTA